MMDSPPEDLVSPASDPMIGRVIGDRYRVLRLLGEGGMARVYEAQHTLISRKVAIKVLRPEVASSPEFHARFLNEGRMVGTLGHPHIVESTDMGYTEDGVPFLVCGLLDGDSLAAVVSREGAFSAMRAATIGAQVASALRVAHEAGIVHRDLKPENIFLSRRDGRDHATIIDFGVSKLLLSGAEGRQTRNGQLLGTPEYMAPEQIEEGHTVDARTDIYALGCVLYMLLAGRPPFEPAPLSELFLRIVNFGAPPILVRRPGLARELAEIIETCMSRAREDRFESIHEVVKALRAFLDHGGAVDAIKTLPPPPLYPHGPFDPPPEPSTTIPTAWTPLKPELASLESPPHGPSPGSASDAQPEPPEILGPPPGLTPTIVPMLVMAYLLGAALMAFFTLREGPASEAPRGLLHAAPASAALSSPSPPEERGAKAVSLHVLCAEPGAQVRFRDVTSAPPFGVDQLRAGPRREAVEITAPGRQGRRFWLDFGETIVLDVRLPPGSGITDATPSELSDAQTTKTALSLRAAVPQTSSLPGLPVPAPTAPAPPARP